MTDNKQQQQLFYLDQHGCAKNQVDGELIISHLENEGWKLAHEPEEADLIIINSCGFIESAKKESLNSLISARQAYQKAKIILAGCLAERYADVFAQDLDEADAVFGNGDLSEISTVVQKLFPEGIKEPSTNIKPVIRPAQEGVCAGDRTKLLNFPGSAYVKITEGCNNCCSFCAIPIIRGQLRSRSIQDICTEVQALLSRGVFEINLIGQDLASYGKGNSDLELFSSNHSDASREPSPLSLLLTALTSLKGSFWIRLLYIHPDNFPLDILPILQKDKRVLPYFDLPFQSGDEQVISLMNRHNTPHNYLSLVEKIRNECVSTFYGDCAIRTTFLCGFPGETDEAALHTKNFLEELKPDWAGCFVYSKEDDTAAFSMKKQIPKKIAQKRMDTLITVQQGITRKTLTRHVGKKLTVLVEEIITDVEGNEGLAIGRAWFQAPEVDGSCVIRYDLTDKNAVNAVQSGKRVFVTVIGSSDVDIDTIFNKALDNNLD